MGASPPWAGGRSGRSCSARRLRYRRAWPSWRSARGWAQERPRSRAGCKGATRRRVFMATTCSPPARLRSAARGPQVDNAELSRGKPRGAMRPGRWRVCARPFGCRAGASAVASVGCACPAGSSQLSPSASVKVARPTGRHPCISAAARPCRGSFRAARRAGRPAPCGSRPPRRRDRPAPVAADRAAPSRTFSTCLPAGSGPRPRPRARQSRRPR
jgi:hypothetical protein